MTEPCRYLSKNESAGLEEYNCILTGKYCVGAVNASGRIDRHGYMAEAAKLCPAYNIEKDLAKSLQTANLEKQKLELEKKLE